MRVRGNTIGALNLFCSKPGGIEAGDLPLGQGMADIAAVALLQERSVGNHAPSSISCSARS